MRRIGFTGAVPSVISENAPARGWAGGLQLDLHPLLVLAVDVVGPHDMFFDARMDTQTGFVSLWNVARPDFEAFSALALPPVLNFQLRAFMADGTIAFSEQEYAVAVHNVDDTPPTGLAFAGAAGVRPGEIGATIGTLAVTDPDSSGPFHFTIGEADEWMFEVVNMQLRLKPGMALSLSDGPFRAILIEVNDGIQSSAFRLQFDVLDPTGQPSQLDVLDPWETIAGFSFKTPTEIWAERGAWEIADIQSYGEALVQIVMRNGDKVWLPRVERIELLNGTIDLRDNSTAFQVNALYDVLFDRPVDVGSLGGWVRALDAGNITWQGAASFMLSSPEFSARFGTLSNQQFITKLYEHTTGGTGDTGGIAWWTSMIDTGVSRSDAALAFARWDFHVGRMREDNPLGYWVDRPFGNELAAMYEVALDRLPEREGFEFWITDLQRGAIGTADLATLFGRANEFLGRFSTMNNSDFVRELYLTVLDREPDPEGFAFWTGHLDRGSLVRADMVRGFSVSDEMRATFSYLPPAEPFI
jgi:hypothetical protein